MAVATLKKNQRKTLDLDELKDLQAYAATKGFKVKENKPSFFRRSMDIISRPLYASAGAAKAIVKGNENVAQEAWKGLKGIDKETYSDVLGEMGVRNKWIKGGVGLALDIALDPTTYFGGTLLKMGAKAVGKGLGVAGRGFASVAPESAEAFAKAGKALKEGVTSAFSVYGGKGTSALTKEEMARHKRLVDKGYEQLNVLSKAKEDVVDLMFKRFEKNVDPDKLERAGLYVYNNRLIEKGIKKGTYKYPQDPQTRELVKAIQELGRESARLAGIKGDKWYFPGFDEMKINRTAEGAAKMDSKIFGLGRQGYLKRFMGKISEETRLKDVRQAFGKRIYEVFRDNLNERFMRNMVNVYGVKAASEADIVANKLVPIFKKDPLQFFKKTITPGEDVLEQMGAQGETFERAMSKVGAMIKGAAKEGIPVSATKRLRKAAGAYYPGTNEIKMRLFRPDVLLHEKGHGWDFMNDRLSNVINTRRDFQKELRILTEKFYGGTAQQRGSAVEKWAVFIDKFIHDSEFVKRNAPTFTAYFRKKLKTDWQFREAYQKAAKQINIINRTVKNIKPNLTAADKEQIATAIRTMFPSKTFMAVKKAKPIGYLKEADAYFLNNIINPEMKTIDNLAKGVGYDKFTDLFKTAVTAYFPAFHIRNFISGMLQNYQVLGARALAPANITTGLAVLKKSNKMLNFPKYQGSAKYLGELLEKRFRGSSRYISDIGDYIQEVTNNQFRMTKISNARKLGAAVEMNQKAGALVTALRKGHSVQEALKLAEKAGFDYAKITQFEQKVMKRLIPFYTFARKNAQLQVETLFKNPERILNQVKVANALSTVTGGKVTDEDIKSLPKWALEGLGFKVKENKYVSKLGLPVEEFIARVNKPLMSTLSSLNPLVKYPMEAKLGYDFFREQRINDVNKIAPALGERYVKAREEGKIPEWLDQLFNVTKYDYQGKTYYSASPRALHIMRNLPTSRIESTLEKIFDKDIDLVNKLTAFFSGAKVYDIDKEYQKYFTERDLKREIQDYLMGKGIGAKYENYYIYK